MDVQDVRQGFFNSIRRVDDPTYVKEDVPYDTEEQGRARFERKVLTYVAGAGERHILRRKK